MNHTTKTVLKWVSIAIGGPFLLLFIVALCIAIFHKQTPAEIAQAKRDKFVEDSIATATNNREQAKAVSQKRIADSSDAASKSEDAYFMSQEFLKKRLKAPATAKFPDYSEAYVHYLGDSIYTVVAYVDAQNTFGALLRNNYHCSLKYEGDNWSAITVELSENN